MKTTWDQHTKTGYIEVNHNLKFDRTVESYTRCVIDVDANNEVIGIETFDEKLHEAIELYLFTSDNYIDLDSLVRTTKDGREQSSFTVYNDSDIDVAEKAADAMNANPHWNDVDNDDNYNAVVEASFEAYDNANKQGKKEEDALNDVYDASVNKVNEITNETIKV